MIKIISEIFKRIILRIYITIHSLILHISIALFQTEQEILKADSLCLDENDKKIQRHRYRNLILEKFYAGQRDEKYVNEYYELLNKADKFKRESTQLKYEIAAWKHIGGRHVVEGDGGNEVNQIGFFDSKHKHVGKTMLDVLKHEYDERKLNDDHYELLYIFNNRPIDVGLTKALSVDDSINDVDDVAIMTDVARSKLLEFPIKIGRDNDNVLNKIEHLTEHLHVKKIAFEHRVLEFFIPIKFKTVDIDSESIIFNEIININEVYVSDNYGNRKSFGLMKFKKRIVHNNTYEVLKFQGIEMENLQ